MRYKVVCNQCKGSRVVDLYDMAWGKSVDWLESEQNDDIKIISMRNRFDGQVGWQCTCGNNDLHTEQELKGIANQASPRPQEIQNIVNNLKPGKLTFELVKV